MAKRLEIDAVFRAIDQITSPVTRMARRVSKSAGKMERSLGKVNGVLGKIRSGARQVGAVGAVAVGAVTAGLVKATTVGADFESTLVSAASKFGGIRRGTKEFDELAAAALRVSGNTKFMGSESAAALEFMATANESAAVAMGSLDQFARFAIANKVGLSRAADIASDSISALGLDMDELGNKITDPAKKIAAYTKVTDLLTTTAVGANLTLEQVFETIKKGASTARNAGQSVETFLAATQAISGVIKGPEAGTGLRRVFNNILKDVGRAGKAIKKLKIKVADPKTGKIRDMVDILDDVKVKLDALDATKRKRALAALFGDAEASGAALLENLDAMRVKVDILQNQSKGKTDLIATLQADTATNAFKTLGSTIETIQIEIFQLMRDDIVDVVKEVTTWAKANKGVFSERFQKSLKFVRENFDKIVSIGRKVALLAAAFMLLSKVLATVQATMSIIATAATITAGSVGLIVLAVLAAIAVIGLLLFFWDDLIQGLKDGNPWIWALTAAFLPLILVIAIIKGTIKLLVAAWTILIDVYQDMIQGVQDGNPVWTALALVFWPVILAIELIKLLAKALMLAWEVLPAFFKSLWESISAIFDGFGDAIESKVKSVRDLINSITGKKSTVKIGVDVDTIKPPDLPPPPETPPPPPAPPDPPGVSQLQAMLLDLRTPKAEGAKPAELPTGVEALDVGSLNIPGLDLAGIDLASLLRSSGADAAVDPNAGQPAPSPQVISTNSELISRTVSESIQAMKLELTLRDPAGAVESIERTGGKADDLTIVNSGDI